MSYSTLENFGSVRALDAIHAAEDAATFERNYLRSEFDAAAKKGDLNAPALFARRVRGRLQTFGEILADELDCRDFSQRSMEILLWAAKEGQPEAVKLMDDIAGHFVDMEASE